MKSLGEIDAIMQSIPLEWRMRWCGGERGPCACMGCVQIGNRMIMFEKANERRFLGDPEYINEFDIPKEIYQKYKVSREEWELWKEDEE